MGSIGLARSSSISPESLGTWEGESGLQSTSTAPDWIERRISFSLAALTTKATGIRWVRGKARRLRIVSAPVRIGKTRSINTRSGEKAVASGTTRVASFSALMSKPAGTSLALSCARKAWS